MKKKFVLPAVMLAVTSVNVVAMSEEGTKKLNAPEVNNWFYSLDKESVDAWETYKKKHGEEVLSLKEWGLSTKAVVDEWGKYYKSTAEDSRLTFKAWAALYQEWSKLLLEKKDDAEYHYKACTPAAVAAFVQYDNKNSDVSLDQWIVVRKRLVDKYNVAQKLNRKNHRKKDDFDCWLIGEWEKFTDGAKNVSLIEFQQASKNETRLWKDVSKKFPNHGLSIKDVQELKKQAPKDLLLNDWLTGLFLYQVEQVKNDAYLSKMLDRAAKKKQAQDQLVKQLKNKTSQFKAKRHSAVAAKLLDLNKYITTLMLDEKASTYTRLELEKSVTKGLEIIEREFLNQKERSYYYSTILEPIITNNFKNISNEYVAKLTDYLYECSQFDKKMSSLESYVYECFRSGAISFGDFAKTMGYSGEVYLVGQDYLENGLLTWNEFSSVLGSANIVGTEVQAFKKHSLKNTARIPVIQSWMLAKKYNQLS